MSFRSHDFNHLVKFNSAVSSEFLNSYETNLNNKLIEKSKERPSKTFAPSSFRCDRLSWFRLRGVSPDTVSCPDTTLYFSAEIGTACHRILQSNLRDFLGDRWIDVSEYLQSVYDDNSKYSTSSSSDGIETLVEVFDPPVRFAVDGIVKLDDDYYLLEIKSSEYSSWNDLTDPKPNHIDQVKCYCTLLKLNKVLFIYIDRQYGGLKCFEYNVSLEDQQIIEKRFSDVMKFVEYGIAPEGLPKNDYNCTPNMCPYFRTCQEYGR